MASPAAKMSNRQKLFVSEYLKDLNATQAAKRAGYSEKTAREQASRLLSNVNITASIDAAMARRAKKFEATQDNVIRELSKLAFSDIKDYLEFKTVKTVIDKDRETGEPIIDYQTVIDVKDSVDVDGAPISEVQLSKDGTFKFKLHDKKSALELLGRHLKLFTDKVELTGDSAIKIKVTVVDDE